MPNASTIKTLIFFFSFLLSATGQTAAISDSTKRQIPFSEIENYRQMSNFQYERLTPKGPSIWASIKEWVWDYILQHIITTESIAFWEFAFYALLILAFLYIAFKVFKMKGRSFFYNQSKDAEINEVFMTNATPTENLNEKMKRFVLNRQFREAIRIGYILILKKLSEHKIIIWRKDKTNFDYLYEIKNPELRNAFRQVTEIFNFTWYGENEIDKKFYDKIEPYFNNFTIEDKYRSL
jgi:hypothetical protein